MVQISIGGNSPYQKRLADDYLTSMLATFPAVLVVGPRACGKTTMAARQAASVVRLDNPAEAGYFRVDPDAALRRFAEPILLDEWQEVPEVLGAVKRSVDSDPRPCRFILTGSVQAQVTTNTWPATGRVLRIPTFPMTMREILGRVKVSTSFIERVQAGNLADFAGANPPVDINGYVSLALQSGYPDVVLNRQANTAAWLSSYVEELVRRDAELVRNGIDTHRFAAYLEAVAAVTAGVVDETTILDATRVDRRTAHAYWAVLENLFIAEEVPAWWSSRLTRLVATGKKYLIDAGLAASILRLTPTSVAQDINWVGRLLDTFVAAQIRPEAALSPSRPRLHHLRTKAGRQEIDLLLEFGGGQVVAIEVKATAAPDIYGSRHLQWLRDQLGDRFTMGLVLHTGPYNFQLDDRIVAAPISTLWA